MLLSLALLSQATVPLRESPAMAAFLAMLGNAWPVALAFAAGLAVICSSSLAVVMLILSLGTDPAARWRRFWRPRRRARSAISA